MPAPDAPALYAVIGNPIAHSQSPFIHAEFARQTGQHIEYTRVLCPLDGFRQTIDAFVAAGGRGCNITVPFKFEAPPLARRLSPRAALAQAANVLSFDQGADGAGGWSADNTDGIGLVNDLAREGCALEGRRVLLLGAGGACAGVLGPFIAGGPAEVVVANRTLDKAQALVERHQPWARQHGVALAARALDAAGTGFDVVINGTASSLQQAAVPVAPQVLGAGAVAVDMMYGPAARGFLAWAQAGGARAFDGLGMLVEQAAEAFHLWRGVRPQTAPVLATLRARLAAAQG